MRTLWTKEKEIEFFREAQNFASPEQLFYLGDDKRFYAYWPKSYKGRKTTLQSRNALIGKFTEKFSANLLRCYAQSKGWHVVQDVICQEIGLTSQSPADIALCYTESRHQPAPNILALFEVKMSIVWNWELRQSGNRFNLECLGDYRSHQGNPGLLRSDSMLKAIGKSINIRVSSYSSSRIPIIILGNTPISKSYIPKVDHLEKCGIIQGFWSLNPNPSDDNQNNLKATPGGGFLRIDSYSELDLNLDRILYNEREYFSSMKTKSELGRIIQLANKEPSLEKKAEKFLSLIRS